MKHNHHKIRSERGDGAFSGGGILSATLDQIVEYAKSVDNKEEAEQIELMCYRLFGRRLTPEAADKIAEIPERFKKKRTPTIQKIVTINKGDKVNKKTIIPSIGNYNETICRQDNNFSMSQLCGQEQKKLGNE